MEAVENLRILMRGKREMALAQRRAAIHLKLDAGNEGRPRREQEQGGITSGSLEKSSEILDAVDDGIVPDRFTRRLPASALGKR